MLQHVHRNIHIGHGTSWVARFWITCLHQRDIFRLPDPEKIMCPWAMGHEQCWHFRMVGTNPCLATGFLSLRHSSSHEILIWLLYPSNSSLPPKVPAAHCTAVDPYRLCQIAPLSCRYLGPNPLTALLFILPILYSFFSPYNDLDPTVGRSEMEKIRYQHSYSYTACFIIFLLPLPFFCWQTGAVSSSTTPQSIWTCLCSASRKNLLCKNCLLTTE